MILFRRSWLPLPVAPTVSKLCFSRVALKRSRRTKLVPASSVGTSHGSTDERRPNTGQGIGSEQARYLSAQGILAGGARSYESSVLKLPRSS